MYLLSSFCNQTLSAEYSLCAFDLENEGASWVDLNCLPEEVQQSLRGTCGVANVGGWVALCTQDVRPLVACVDPHSGKILYWEFLVGCKDAHSMVFRDGWLYLISTGTNEIYRIEVSAEGFGRQELFWRYPGVNYGTDLVHLNGITLDGDRLIASCFGSKNADGRWGQEGSIFYIDTMEIIKGGLVQPHTPLVVQNRLFFAESGANKVFVFEREQGGAWGQTTEINLPGYTRGLALGEGDKLIVGISAARKISRSKSVPIPERKQSADTSIIEVTLGSLEQRTLWNLAAFGREIYDLLIIPSGMAMSFLHEALANRVKAMEEPSLAAMANLKRLEAELGAREVQLANMMNSTSWRITSPLRGLKQWLNNFAG